MARHDQRVVAAQQPDLPHVAVALARSEGKRQGARAEAKRLLHPRQRHRGRHPRRLVRVERTRGRGRSVTFAGGCDGGHPATDRATEIIPPRVYDLRARLRAYTARSRGRRRASSRRSSSDHATSHSAASSSSGSWLSAIAPTTASNGSPVSIMASTCARTWSNDPAPIMLPPFRPARAFQTRLVLAFRLGTLGTPPAVVKRLPRRSRPRPRARVALIPCLYRCPADPPTQETRMKLIGVGFGRTGTMSLKAAIERLGAGPCFHMIDLIEGEGRDRDLPYWVRIANGEPVDWNEVFDGWQSTVDWPACSRWRELIDA